MASPEYRPAPEGSPVSADRLPADIVVVEGRGMVRPPEPAAPPALFAGTLERVDQNLSARERNATFLSRPEGGMIDASYLSGLDLELDGRAFVWSDFDGDGRIDLAVISRNAPILRIFHNRVPWSADWIALELTGDPAHSNRDAVGSRVTLTCEGRSPVVREHAVGTGFAAQNSSLVTVGLGSCPTVKEIAVRWPSGRIDRYRDVETRRRYRLVEGASAVAAVVPTPVSARTVPATRGTGSGLLEAIRYGTRLGPDAGRNTHPVLYVDVWASWCDACVRNRPRVDALARRFAGRVDFVGLSAEAADGVAEISAYAEKHRPAYPLLAFSERSEHESAIGQIREILGPRLVLPSTILISRHTGKVLLAVPGVPSASQVESVLFTAREIPSLAEPGALGCEARLPRGPRVAVGLLSGAILLLLWQWWRARVRRAN